MTAILIERRLAELRRRRQATPGQASPNRLRTAETPPHVELARLAAERADRLAEAVDGTVVVGPLGRYVRVEHLPSELPIDRPRLAEIPGAPRTDQPLVCLDTETTGLGSAAGTVVFLVGLATWQANRFLEVQLVLADEADEGALLDALESAIPPNACLVTYNGRGFDWPILVTRYRLAGRRAPAHADHLDLLPFVRRVYRHRLPDARLRTVEEHLLTVSRGRDVDGADIPHRYLEFLRRGSTGPLEDVIRHNREDVRSLARLLCYAERGLGDRDARRTAPAGDLAGLARAFTRAGRADEALACLDAALEARPITRRSWSAILTTPADRADRSSPHFDRDALLVERARVLRRLRQTDAAFEAWHDLAIGGGTFAGIAWLEVAKLLEHRRRDLAGALEACSQATRIAERLRWLGRPLHGLEADLVRRRRRLLHRVALARKRIAAQSGQAAEAPENRSRPNVPSVGLVAGLSSMDARPSRRRLRPAPQEA